MCFNPNLYSSGKVCLSLPGAYRTPCLFVNIDSDETMDTGKVGNLARHGKDKLLPDAPVVLSLAR